MLIASAFMPVSLLTPIAAGLGATAGQAGQAISLNGFFAVLASLAKTTLAGNLNSRADSAGVHPSSNSHSSSGACCCAP
jgi:predicted MFS family arabinose efflux permease